MAEGAPYIRIGLPPCVVSGDRLFLSCCGLTAYYLHCRRAYPMSRDWGCTSTYFPSSYVPTLVYAALGAIVTIPPLDPSARDEEEPDYDEEAQVWAAAMEHAAEVEDEETPDEYDWQISRLESAATYTAGPDAGRVSTGRMKIT